VRIGHGHQQYLQHVVDGTKKKTTTGSVSAIKASVCAVNSIRAEVAEKQVAEKLKAVITQPEILEAEVARMNQQLQERKAPMARELERLMQDIQEKEANVQKFLNLMIEAPEIASDLTKRIKQLEQEKQMLLQKEQQLQRTLRKGVEQIPIDEARRA
jgi:site-specific DNA recombinase